MNTSETFSQFSHRFLTGAVQNLQRAKEMGNSAKQRERSIQTALAQTRNGVLRHFPSLKEVKKLSAVIGNTLKPDSTKTEAGNTQDVRAIYEVIRSVHNELRWGASGKDSAGQGATLTPHQKEVA